MTTRRQIQGGYAAILAAVLMFLVCAVGIVFLASFAFRTSQRRDATGTMNRDVFEAIVGNPERGTFGYLGDSGGYPADLTALLTPGTNAPLVRDVALDNNGDMIDGFFGPLEYWRSIGGPTLSPATHGIAIISRGPDHSSSNNSATPNDATTFIGTNPTLAGYPTTPDNVDNMTVPDMYTTGSAFNVGYTGTLTYNFTNRDTVASATNPTCPAAYAVEVVSDSRGSTNERLIAPVAGSASFELVQGFYTMRLLANSNQSQVYYTESVAVYPGATTTRNLNTNSVAPGNAATPAFLLRIVNQTGANLWIRRPRTASDIVTSLANNAAINVAAVSACEKLEARTAAAGGGSLTETVYMSWGTTIKTVTSTTFTYSVNVTGNNPVVVLVGNPGVIAGSVYKLRRKVFTIPANSRVQVLGHNGTSLTVIAHLTANQSATF